MAKFDIPPKPNLAKQLLASALILIATGIVFAILAKLTIAFIIFLLGMIAGIGSQVVRDNPFGKD